MCVCIYSAYYQPTLSLYVYPKGMSCGLADANALYSNLQSRNFTDLPAALAAYSDDRVKEGNAITDLNFIRMLRSTRLLRFMLRETWEKKIWSLPTMLEELQDPSVPYSAIYERYCVYCIVLNNLLHSYIHTYYFIYHAGANTG